MRRRPWRPPPHCAPARWTADELAAVARALESVAPVAGRLQMRALGGLLVIDDTYNANPRSVRAALDAAHESAQAPGARLVVALGDMLELGALAPAMHAEVVADVMRLAPAAFIAVGPEMSAAAAAAGDSGARRRASSHPTAPPPRRWCARSCARATSCWSKVRGASRWSA